MGRKRVVRRMLRMVMALMMVRRMIRMVMALMALMMVRRMVRMARMVRAVTSCLRWRSVARLRHEPHVGHAAFQLFFSGGMLDQEAAHALNKAREPCGVRRVDEPDPPSR